MEDNLRELDKNQRPIHPLPEGDIAHIRWLEMIKPDKTLNEAEILSIKRLRAKGVPYEDIAARMTDKKMPKVGEIMNYIKWYRHQKQRKIEDFLWWCIGFWPFVVIALMFICALAALVFRSAPQNCN